MVSQIQADIVRYLKDQVIDGYMLTDLDRMVGFPVVPNQLGNCNFPIAMYIFSCIEFLGSLVSEQPILGGLGVTQNRVWAYMELTFRTNLQVFQQHRGDFVQIFRHGMVHEFFAKNAGVSRGELDVFGLTPGGKPSLDADRFYEVFRESCEELKFLIDSSDELAERVADRYLDMQRRNRASWPAMSPVPPSITTAYVSGASGARQPDASMTTPSFPPDDNDI